MIYLCDIDGTIADIEHRLYFIQQNPADWQGFFAACPDDDPIPEVIRVIRLLSADADTDVIMVTGRSDEVREQTEDWLVETGISYDGLYMRKAGDHREDNIVKRELLDKIRADNPQNPIVGAFEDRQQVVDMFRAEGIRVFQVAPGNF